MEKKSESGEPPEILEEEVMDEEFYEESGARGADE